MNNEIAAWLEHLRILYPPTGVVLVGAGAGAGEWVQWLVKWDAANVTLIEADDAQFQRLQRELEAREDWRLCRQVIADESETVTFYQASNPAESSLIEPEALGSLWPNLKTVNKQTREAICLAELLQDAPVPPGWLLVDCLSALPIIQGLGSLANLDVIVARVLLNSEGLPASASLAMLESDLASHGFRLLATQSSRHPDAGHALFVRDAKATARALVQQQAQAEQEQQEYKRSIERKMEEAILAAKAEQAEESAAILDAANQAKNAAEKLAAERLEQIKKNQYAAEQTAGERAAQLETLKQEHMALLAEKDKLLAEETKRLEALALAAQGEKAAWNKEKSELLLAKEKADKLISEKQAQISALELRLKQVQVKSADTEARQHQLEEEIIKGEAQLVLLKSLLRPEKSS